MEIGIPSDYSEYEIELVSTNIFTKKYSTQQPEFLEKHIKASTYRYIVNEYNKVHKYKVLTFVSLIVFPLSIYFGWKWFERSQLIAKNYHTEDPPVYIEKNKKGKLMVYYSSTTPNKKV